MVVHGIMELLRFCTDIWYSSRTNTAPSILRMEFNIIQVPAGNLNKDFVKDACKA